MPIAGRSKKAYPHAVRDALLQYLPGMPRPHKTESFKDYAKRVKGRDVFFDFLMANGEDGPDQREYLCRLEEVADLLYQLRKKLDEAWPR